MKENSNGFKVFKKAVGLITGVGVAAIIGNAVKHVSPTSGTGALLKGAVYLGTLALGGICCDAADKYVDKTIDEAAEMVKTVADNLPDEDSEIVEVK